MPKNRATHYKPTLQSFACFFSLTFSIIFQNGHAAEIFKSETIPVENRSPIIQLFSLSRPDYTIQKKINTTHWKSRFEITNYFSTNRKENEYLFIDGETWTITNTFQHQLSNNFILNECSTHKSSKIYKGIFIGKEEKNIVFKVGHFISV